MAAGSVRTAQEGANAVPSVLSGFASDLFVLRGSVRSRRKKGTPLDWEIHANPLGIGALAVGGGLALWLMQLRMHPKKIIEMKTVIDQAAYIETIGHPAVGHSEPNMVPYGEPIREWQEGTWIKGVYKPGQFFWHQPMQVDPAGGSHWIVDCEEWIETISHGEISHQEPTGKELKSFSIEQRPGFLGDGVGTIPGIPEDIVGSTAKMLGLAGAGWIPLIGHLIFGKK